MSVCSVLSSDRGYKGSEVHILYTPASPDTSNLFQPFDVGIPTSGTNAEDLIFRSR